MITVGKKLEITETVSDFALVFTGESVGLYDPRRQELIRRFLLSKIVRMAVSRSQLRRSLMAFTSK